MPSKVLILSQNDRHHKLENLGSMIVEWTADLEDVEIEVSHDRSTISELDDFELCIFCVTPGEMTNEEEQSLADFVNSGKDLLPVHSATVVNERNTKYIELIGARFTHHSPYHEFQVKIENAEHPVTKGLEDFTISDELYVLDRDPEGADILAATFWEDKLQPMVYTKKYGKGTVLYNALGHNEASFKNPGFRQLIVQGIKWLLH
jgi:type 1 glutamine amidotransferase